MNSIDQITVRAPGKINLFLKVLGRRSDGYHEIYSLVQAVSIYDTLEVSRRGSGLTLSCCPPIVPEDESNLVWRAWDQLRTELEIEAEGVEAEAAVAALVDLIARGFDEMDS